MRIEELHKLFKDARRPASAAQIIATAAAKARAGIDHWEFTGVEYDTLQYLIHELRWETLREPVKIGETYTVVFNWS